MEIPLFRPTIKRRDMDRVLTCMVSDRIGPGTRSGELAAAVAEYLQAEKAWALASYDAALSVALEALELPAGSGVVVSALSPALYMDVLERAGLKPLLADVDERTLTLSPETLPALKERGAAAVLAHYPLGLIPDMARLVESGLPLIEDLSHGIGGYVEERLCGGFGEMAVVSLDPTGIITAGGGGLLVARGRSYSRRCAGSRLLQSSALPDLNASLALAQIKEIESFVGARKQIAQAYARALQGSRHRAVLQVGDGEAVYGGFPVMVQSGMREARQYARRKGVETAAAFEGSVVADREVPGDTESDLAQARGALLRVLAFPLYPTLGKARVESICKVLSTLP